MPSARSRDLAARVTAFMDAHVYQAEAAYEDHVRTAADRWTVPPVMEALKAKAKAAGLWNLFLPESELGAGLSNAEYAPLCEIMGRSLIGAEAFNCSAPDTGNMEVLVRYGTSAQKEQWLKPLSLLHDRAGRGLVRRHQHPLLDPAGRQQRLRRQRPQVVGERRARSAL
jgi:acyl-CoA dehydrogenase